MWWVPILPCGLCVLLCNLTSRWSYKHPCRTQAMPTTPHLSWSPHFLISSRISGSSWSKKITTMLKAMQDVHVHWMDSRIIKQGLQHRVIDIVEFPLLSSCSHVNQQDQLPQKNSNSPSLTWWEMWLVWKLGYISNLLDIPSLVNYSI